ncbi:MAG: GNAT family N-acetyltransferase [Clostridia bacterium]|nr:GNAT family N-acetyltransferase [Clostridia bacterium]
MIGMSTPDKKALWSLCFGDSEEVAEDFFAIPDVLTLTEHKNGRLVGMASLIPVMSDSSLLGYYAYGVCVHPDHRGGGIFRRLMERCEAQAIADGKDLLCLIPATEALVDTYTRMGYSSKIELFDKASERSHAIRSTSRGFSEFAAPDGADTPLLTADLGLLKAFSHMDEDTHFCFAEPMGER